MKGSRSCRALNLGDMNVVLDATNLYRFFHAGDDETLALRGVSLRVEAGEVVAVTGPSGSGKSTLLACLAGLDEPDGGTVRIEDHVMTRRPEAERARRTAVRSGWRDVAFDNICRVADALGVHPGELFPAGADLGAG